jgi:hypothetical protein
MGVVMRFAGCAVGVIALALGFGAVVIFLLPNPLD